MTPFRKILVPLDLGPTSPAVLEAGRMLADACGASLHVMHVIGSLERQGGTSIQQDVCERLEALLQPEDRSKRRVTTSCQIGTPGLEITDYAAQHGVDLIVMGTHPHAPTFQMLTGSVAEHVVAQAPCAVLVVKAPGAPPVCAEFDPPVSAGESL